MRIITSDPRLTGCLLWVGASVALSGCSADKLARNFGLTRDAPDEYTVTTRAPLSMPPDFDLRPPRPGAARPQEQSERQQAQEALVPQTALNAPRAGTSAGQSALVQQAGPAAPNDIRGKVDQDASNGRSDDGLISRLLNWRGSNPAQAQVDAPKEAQRLRQDAALGQAPNVGETPIIEPQKPGWFSSLFSWM